MAPGLIFWEKTGCAGNARQKALLRSLGLRLDVRDLRAETWTPQRLRPFFGNLSVVEWFNLRAPRIMRGELRPETLSETEALALLVAEPLLIRRPLIEAGRARRCGFDPAWVAMLSGVDVRPDQANEACPHPPDRTSCVS